MKTYKATFTGREINSIGINHKVRTTIKGANKENARLNLYENYEHIMNLTLIEQKEQVLSFCVYSQTIRQLPENYLIASFDGNNWTCEPDLAANEELCTRVFLELFNYDSKYQKEGLKLLAKVTPNSEFNKSKECKKVLQLMDKNINYSKALNIVLTESKTELEKELNNYI